MHRRESGIAGLLGQLRQPEPPQVKESPAPTPKPPAPPAARAAERARRVEQKQPAPAHLVATPADAPAAPPREERGPGRARTGKRSNPDYALRGLWLRTETYLDVTDRIRRRREHADASELVQTLLENWLREDDQKAR